MEEDESRVALESLNKALEVARDRLNQENAKSGGARDSSAANHNSMSAASAGGLAASTPSASVPERVAYFERENARLVKQLREAESTASELADELDSAKRTADSATSMVERLQAENGSLRERLTAETAAVEDTTRRMAADASRAQRALENKHVEDMRDLSAELLSSRGEIEALRTQLAGRQDALSLQLRDVKEATTVTERAAADAAEAHLAQEAAEARAVAAEAAAEAAKAEAREALVAVAGLEAGLAATWRRMEGAMSDGISTAAAAAAALIADAEHTLLAKLRTAHEKADRLAERCAALETQVGAEQSASSEAARLRRAAAGLLALNERLLERLAPGTRHAASQDGDSFQAVYRSNPQSPSRMAATSGNIRDGAMLEGLRAAVDLVSGPQGSVAGRPAHQSGAAWPVGAPHPGVVAVASAAAQRSHASAEVPRPTDPLLALARSRAGALSRQDASATGEEDAQYALSGWRLTAPPPRGQDGFSYDDGLIAEGDEGLTEYGELPPAQAPSLAKQRAITRRRTAGAQPSAAGSRAAAPHTAAARAMPAAARAAAAPGASRSAPRASAAARIGAATGRSSTTSAARTHAQTLGLRSASPYSRQAWMLPATAVAVYSEDHHGAAEGADRDGVQPGAHARTVARAHTAGHRPSLEKKAVGAKAAAAETAYGTLPAGAVDALLTAADALQREFEASRDAYGTALASISANGSGGADRREGDGPATVAELQRTAIAMQEKCRSLVSVLATIGGEQRRENAAAAF